MDPRLLWTAAGLRATRGSKKTSRDHYRSAAWRQQEVERASSTVARHSQTPSVRFEYSDVSILVFLVETGGKRGGERRKGVVVGRQEIAAGLSMDDDDVVHLESPDAVDEHLGVRARR